MAHLQLSLLGAFRATLDGAPLTAFGYDKVRALLAFLAVECDRPHHRESLAGLLWPDYPERTARRSLSQALSRMRRTLEDERVDRPFIEVTRQTLQFNPASDYWLDAVAFTQALDACEKHTHESLERCGECLERLEGGVALYRGAFLEGFSIADSAAFEEWLLLHRERLHRLALETLHRLAHCYAASGEYEKALPHAWRQVALDPWREVAQRQLMRTLALNRQRGAALAQYEVCRRLLAEELGVEPGAETAALYERIRSGVEIRHEPDGSADLPHNLPPQPTPFVGREQELARLARRVADPTCRLLTLVGPGGIGKTRLAIQAAQAAVDATGATPFSSGVYFVPLVSVSAADALVPTIAGALNFSFFPVGEPTEQLLSYLRNRDMLLVLDGFEHLLFAPAGATSAGRGGRRLVTEMLAAAPGLKLLVTSREALNLQGEWFHPVAGMDFPAVDGVESEGARVSLEDYSAIELFVESARRAYPGFRLSEEQRWVVRICQLVEGMPLAIEMAAAWLKALSPAQVAGELERGLDVLTTSLRDVPVRHRSMRAVFDHSWRLLSEPERTVLQALSLFRGGFQAGAAQAVAGASLSILAGLVEKSLLRRTLANRYQMHELFRQYAVEKLCEDRGAEARARDRYVAFFADLLQRCGETLRGSQQESVLRELDVEVDNARAAWDMAVAQRQIERLEQAVKGLCPFYSSRGRYQEGETACRMAAEGLAGTRSSNGLRVLARILTWQSCFNEALGLIEIARQLLGQSLSVLDNPALAGCDTRPERAFTLLKMGRMVSFSGDVERAKRFLEQSLALYRELDDQSGMASALVDLAWEAEMVGAISTAQRMYKESLRLQRALGNKRGIAFSLIWLSATTAHQGQIEEAERLARESLTIVRASDERAYTIIASLGSSYLGQSLLWSGRFAEASSALEESIAKMVDSGACFFGSISYFRATCRCIWVDTKMHATRDGRA